MALTVAQLRSQARMLYIDSDSLNYALKDADLLLLMNEVVYWLRQKDNLRVSMMSDTTVFGGTGTSVAGGVKLVTTILYDIQDVQAVYRETGATTTGGTPMERVEPADIFGLQNTSATQGTPTRWAAQRRHAIPSGGQQGAWDIFLHPITDATAYYFSLHGPREPVALSSDTDAPDATTAECYTIARVVAVEAARLLGRDQAVIANILRLVPEEVQDALKLSAEALLPRGRPLERAR